MYGATAIIGSAPVNRRRASTSHTVGMYYLGGYGRSMVAPQPHKRLDGGVSFEASGSSVAITFNLPLGSGSIVKDLSATDLIFANGANRELTKHQEEGGMTLSLEHDDPEPPSAPPPAVPPPPAAPPAPPSPSPSNATGGLGGGISQNLAAGGMSAGTMGAVIGAVCAVVVIAAAWTIRYFWKRRNSPPPPPSDADAPPAARSKRGKRGTMFVNIFGANSDDERGMYSMRISSRPEESSVPPPPSMPPPAQQELEGDKTSGSAFVTPVTDKI